MHRALQKLMIPGLLLAVLWGWSLVRDRQALNEELIRLHVVGASDSFEDQNIKLQVRDAILEALEGEIRTLPDVQTARAYFRENLPRIREIAGETLENLGKEKEVLVRLQKESFPIRHYKTFTLPSGVYDSLRVVIGEGKGHNWWCVAYPSLCLPAASKSLDSVAADAGLSDPLVGAIRREKPYEIRFFLLDLLGRLETAWQKP